MRGKRLKEKWNRWSARCRKLKAQPFLGYSNQDGWYHRDKKTGALI